jgi:uncharacterized protein
MQILVDADALPSAIKTIIFRAAERKQIKLTLVANQFLRTPNKPNISMVTVAKKPDEADDYIVDIVKAGDLVITADIPLADRVINKHAYALDPRGELFTESNIKSRLATRDLMEQLRSEGIVEGGPSSFNTKNAQQFANQLDRFLTKHIKAKA